MTFPLLNEEGKFGCRTNGVRSDNHRSGRIHPAKITREPASPAVSEPQVCVRFEYGAREEVEIIRLRVRREVAADRTAQDFGLTERIGHGLVM